MGDRANIKLVESRRAPDEHIYLYTHWGGLYLPQILRQALIRGRLRWGDPSYLNRIIFSEMIKHHVLDETGFGIATYMVDGQERIIEVDHDKQTVTFVNSYGERPTTTTYTFEELIADGPTHWPEFHDPR